MPRPAREIRAREFGKRHLAVVGALVIPPAKVDARLLRRNVGEGMVHRLHVHAGALAELRQAQVSAALMLLADTAAIEAPLVRSSLEGLVALLESCRVGQKSNPQRRSFRRGWRTRGLQGQHPVAVGERAVVFADGVEHDGATSPRPNLAGGPRCRRGWAWPSPARCT
jgi:hypothetical protein